MTTHEQSCKELEKNENIWLNIKECSTNCNKKGITRVICHIYYGKGKDTSLFPSFQLLDPFKVRSFKKITLQLWLMGLVSKSEAWMLSLSLG